MPDSWTTYTPPPYAPACTPLPAYNNGFITFGSFSNPRKINGSTIDLWANCAKNCADSQIQRHGFTASGAPNRRSVRCQRHWRWSVLYLGWRALHFIARYADIDLPWALSPIPADLPPTRRCGWACRWWPMAQLSPAVTLLASYRLSDQTKGRTYLVHGCFFGRFSRCATG